MKVACGWERMEKDGHDHKNQHEPGQPGESLGLSLANDMTSTIASLHSNSRPSLLAVAEWGVNHRHIPFLELFLHSNQHLRLRVRL
jgi:hypothetical protein